MRFARIPALWLLCLFYCAELSSSGQTTFPVPGSGDQGAPRPPVVDVRPKIASPNAAANRQRVLGDLQQLVTESQTLQRDLEASPGGTVSAESFKRSQKIEMLSKRIRKTLKGN